MAKEIKGRAFILKIDASILGSANKFSLTPNRDTIEVPPTFGSGRSKSYVVDRFGYTVATEGLVLSGEASTQTSYFHLLDTMANTDTSVAWTGTPFDASTGDQWFSGWGYITSAPYKTGEGEFATYTIDLQGCGDLTINTL